MVSHVLDRKLWRDLRRMRSHIITLSLLIICGLSLMIAAGSSYQSLLLSRDRFYQENKFAELFAEFHGAPRSLVKYLAEHPGIRELDARLVASGLVKFDKQAEPAIGHFVSLPLGRQPRLNQLSIRQGRLPEMGSYPEIFVHEAFAQANHLALGDNLRIQINGQQLELKVVGMGLSPEFIYAIKAGIPLPDDKHFGVFWLNENILGRLLKAPDSFNSITVTLDGSSPPEAVKKTLQEFMNRYGLIAVNDRMQRTSHMFVEDELKEQKTMSIISPLIFLSIAAFLIHMIFTRLIIAQRPQIAVLKAVGYFDREIIIHYSKLVATMMLCGTIPALLLGVWLAYGMKLLYAQFFRFPTHYFVVDPRLILAGLIAGIGPGFLGAFTSIRSILRLPPAEALKPPAPTAYKNRPIELMFGLSRLSTLNRITLRNLLLRPMRLLMTILGVALALAIMISSGSMRDMVHFMLELQFQYVQREDLSIDLIRPTGQNGVQEIRGLPGVLQVEAYRAVPIRLVSKDRKRELGLLGWPSRSELRQRITADLRKIALPAQGLLLSRYFEKEWGLRLGDRVDIEILEGSFPHRSVVVAGFSDDLLGAAAHMRIEELWQLLGEQNNYNQLCLQVDGKFLTAVYQQLHQYPSVAAISLRSSLYRGFYESMGRLMQLSISVLILFAFTIAIGLIYNNVSMNFSERSWEIASLRVIGFDRRAVFLLLLDSIFVQVFLSLIPGCYLGYLLTKLLTLAMRTETISLPPVVSYASYALGILTIFAALLLSAWSLSRMIRRLSLTEALKAKE